jgi:hypothetical protein
MLAGMRNRIRVAYETMRQLEPEVNPVKKILCVVTGCEAEDHIDKMVVTMQQRLPMNRDDGGVYDDTLLFRNWLAYSTFQRRKNLGHPRCSISFGQLF